MRKMRSSEEKKTGKTKKFYIGDIVKKVIENYIKELSNLDMSNYVFQSRKGENMPITRQQAYRILNNSAEMIDLVEKNEKE